MNAALKKIEIEEALSELQCISGIIVYLGQNPMEDAVPASWVDWLGRQAERAAQRVAAAAGKEVSQ
jgi:hypothetical protein